ncbi:MAG: CHRD domain-containing protein [Alphaproteobacteria bacterium]|nr:CHRD domain-containing protein [Alphaproteobacteria bacterium]
MYRGLGAAAMIIIAAACFLQATPGVADTLRFQGQLAGNPDAPNGAAAGKGAATLTLDTATKTVSWTIEYSGMAAAANEIGCGVLDRPAPIIEINGALNSPITGSKAIADADIASLRAGQWFCLIGSNPGGAELGGEIKPIP